MELAEEFNPADVPEDDRSFDPLPAGDYVMQVIESEVKLTKNGLKQKEAGQNEKECDQQLVLTLEVMEGPHSNRRVWDRLNIVNQNADAQRIAQRAMADLCLAIDVGPFRDSEVLHFKPFIGRLTIKADKTGQYGPQNAVKYKPRGGASPARSAPAPAAAVRPSQPAAAKPAAKPWAKSA